MQQDRHETKTQFLDLGGPDEARRIAFRAFSGQAPSLMWLGGFRSDMLGTKAERLSAFAAARSLGFCRFDYSGHGESSGRFEDGTISRWLEEARAVLDETTSGPVILVGSSMGAWIAIRLAQMLKEAGETSRLAGLLLLAPAPDFTRLLMEPQLTDEQREALERQGYFTVPSEYSSDPNVYTKALFEDGRANSVMDRPIAVDCPVHVIQGMADPDVPYTHALDLVSNLPETGVVLTLVRDGDHRLSRENDLLRIERAAADLVAAFQEDRS